MRRVPLVALSLLCALSVAPPAKAGPVYLALGDSVTFGETDLHYVPSSGDRGYVARYADYLASTRGVRPEVVNLAIDGETAQSFMTGVGRLPPVVGRTDAILAAQNLHYAGSPQTPQQSMLLSSVAAGQAAGNTIETVSISLGFNDLFSLTPLPNAQALIAPTLAAYEADYSAILGTIRQLLPDTDLFLLNYYNPFPADPGNPATALAATGGPQLNSIIAKLAAQFGGHYVDTATPFVGREAELTYMDEMPAGSQVGGPFGGTLPIGNVHANAAGYEVIANAQIAAVPEPSSLLLLAAGACALRARRRI